MSRRIEANTATQGELRASLADLSDLLDGQAANANSRFTSVDVALRDVDRGVQALRDKQELHEAQVLLAKYSDPVLPAAAAEKKPAAEPATVAAAPAVAAATAVPVPQVAEAVAPTAVAPPPAAAASAPPPAVAAPSAPSVQFQVPPQLQPPAPYQQQQQVPQYAAAPQGAPLPPPAGYSPYQASPGKSCCHCNGPNSQSLPSLSLYPHSVHMRSVLTSSFCP